jgi:hypothetical protein
LINALRAADKAGEYNDDQAGDTSALLSLKEVKLAAAGAVEVFLIILDDNSGGLRSRSLHDHYWLGLHHHHCRWTITGCIIISVYLFV